MTTKSAAGATRTAIATWSTTSNGSTKYSSLATSNRIATGGFSLTYEDGPQHNADGSPAWKNCDHTRTSTWDFGVYGCDYTRGAGRVVFNHPMGYGTIFLPPSTSYLPKAPTSLSLPSFQSAYAAHQAEIFGDVKSLFFSAENFASLFSGKSLYKSAQTGVESLINLFGKKGTFKDAVKALAGLDLARMFSVESTARDIESSLSIMDNMRTHIAKLRARQSSEVLLFKTTTSNTSRESQTVTYRWSGTGYPTNAIPRDLTAIEELYKIASYTLFSRLKVRYSGDTLSEVHYLIGALGLDKPLSSIWAIIPMSFLLDYIVSIQTLTDRLDSQLNHAVALQSQCQIGSSWYTSNVTTKASAMIKSCAVGDSSTLGSSTDFKCSRMAKLFNRHPVPTVNIFSGWTDPGSVTLRKAATVAEIAFQIFA